MAIREPLLAAKKKIFSGRAFAAWVLRFIMWFVFLAWIAALVTFPTIKMGRRKSARGSSIGLDVLALLVFGAPILIVSTLAAVYLEIRPKHAQKRKPQVPSISLWTHPVLVDGFLGVVSAAELFVIIAFLAYLVWAMANYAISDTALVQRFMEIPLIKMRFMLWQLWSYIVGLRLGILGLVCMAFLFLPIARGSSLLRLIDIPFEHAVKYHVWLGHLTMALFTLHGLCFVVVWISQGRLIEQLLAWQRNEVANLPGVIALLAGLALWVTSFGYVRQGFFELFFYTHQLYVVFVVFMAFHIGSLAFNFCLAGIFLYMLDRFLRFCQSRKAVEVLSSRVLPCGTIEVLLPKPRGLSYNSLSFVFMNIPGISHLQWHPFSVSSSPFDARDSVSFLIKPLGSWTEELQKIVKETTSVRSACPLFGVEGPYGHESDYYLKYDALVLVAGGIGVSPFVALLRDLLHRYNMNQFNLPTEVTLIWAVKSSKELNLINLVQPELICSNYTSKINLVIQAYVTRETEADIENPIPVPSKHILSMQNCVKQTRPISSLVGTYSNAWMSTYTLVSIAGFLLVQGLMQKFYLGSDGDGISANTVSWTLKSGVLLISMLCGAFLFGGLVIFLWSWVESWRERESVGETAIAPVNGEESDEVVESLVGTSNVHYGKRPDFKELFDGFAKKWRGLNVGVLICGPSTLQTSVAAQCKFHNTANLRSCDIAFHYHSVSFDL